MNREEAVERFKFRDMNHLNKFTEYLSGAKLKVIKQIDHITDEGEPFDVVCVRVLYTDGDGGALRFSFSEMHEREGFAVGNVDCRYCEINMEHMQTVIDIFENPEDWEDGEVVVFEAPCVGDSWEDYNQEKLQ